MHHNQSFHFDIVITMFFSYMRNLYQLNSFYESAGGQSFIVYDDIVIRINPFFSHLL